MGVGRLRPVGHLPDRLGFEVASDWFGLIGSGGQRCEMKGYLQLGLRSHLAVVLEMSPGGLCLQSKPSVCDHFYDQLRGLDREPPFAPVCPSSIRSYHNDLLALILTQNFEKSLSLVSSSYWL